MDHKLRVLVRLDIDCTSAVLVVSGCLTVHNCASLVSLVVRALALVDGLRVVVNIRNAMHIESAAVGVLTQVIADCTADAVHVPIVILGPNEMPACPALAALEGLRPSQPLVTS